MCALYSNCNWCIEWVLTLALKHEEKLWGVPEDIPTSVPTLVLRVVGSLDARPHVGNPSQAHLWPCKLECKRAPAAHFLFLGLARTCSATGKKTLPSPTCHLNSEFSAMTFRLGVSPLTTSS